MLLVAGGATACVDFGNDQLGVTVWEAQLAPAAAYPGLSGQAAALSDAAGTAVGIGLDGAAPRAAHVWGVGLGTCVSPGQQIGADADYPALVVSDSGSASAETHLGPRLIASTRYHVNARVSSTDTARIACGDLTAR